MTTIKQFVRRAPTPLLREHFERIGLAMPVGFDWFGDGSSIAKRVSDVLGDYDGDPLERFRLDVDRISHMADELGEAALYATTSDTTALDAQSSRHARAYCSFLYRLPEFRRAEEARFADERRRGRNWDGFLYESGQGLLVEAGYDDVVSVETDGQEELVSLLSVGEDGSLGYLAPHAGFVKVPREQLIRHRVDVSRLLQALVAELDLPKQWSTSELLPGLLWEVPFVRIGKASSRRSIWFVRRLSHPVVARDLALMMQRRPSLGGRVILTSTAAEHLPAQMPNEAILVSVRDVLRTMDDVIIHTEVLEGHLRGAADPQDETAPVWLSPDGKRLRLRGGHEFHFSSEKHTIAIRKLVDGYRRGRPVPVAALTNHGHPRRLFGRARWEELAPFLKSCSGSWYFDV